MNYDKLSKENIYRLIAEAIVSNDDVIDFYGNESWDSEEETEYDAMYLKNNSTSEEG